MRKEIIQTGATVEEAINSACLRLGYKREECEWDIVDLPKSSFFGLKKIPAKVRVWLTLTPEQEKQEQEEEARIERQRLAKEQAKQMAKSPIKEDPKPKAEPKTKDPVGAAQKEATQVKPSSVINRVNNEEDVRGKTAEDQEKAELSLDYINEMLNNMSIESETEIRWENGGLTLAIYGKSLGVLIGRRGETLNSVQYLAGLVANRLGGDYLRVTVDCGDYRLKRTNSLIEMAKKSAEQVVKTNVSKTLEAMNPAERRIVHSIISEIEGVSSISVGKDPYRRVMIKTPTSKTKAFPNHQGKNEKRVGGYKHSNDRKPREYNKPREYQASHEDIVSTDVTVPEIDPKEVGETPLYGKIEL